MSTTDYMILAKGIDYKRMVNTLCYLSEKVDGVPGIFQKGKPVLSRQGKPITSVEHINGVMQEYLPEGIQVIGELHIPGEPFKVSSGKVRKGMPCYDIQLGIWDVVDLNNPGLSYGERMNYLADKLYFDQRILMSKDIWEIPRVLLQVSSSEFAEEYVKVYYDSVVNPRYKERISKLRPERPVESFGDAEGVIVRPACYSYSTGRSWGLMRYVPKPTLDLKVVAVEEATANRPMSFLGEPFDKGMGLKAIGAFLVKYKDNTIVKVGAGCMSHGERRFYWENLNLIIGKIIEVEYKKDPTYDALREPIFKCIRNDKDKADY